MSRDLLRRKPSSWTGQELTSIRRPYRRRHIKTIHRKIGALLPDHEIVHSVYRLGYVAAGYRPSAVCLPDEYAR